MRKLKLWVIFTMFALILGSATAREVRFDVDADDYAELWIDGNSVGLIDYIPGGSLSATLDLAPGWHDIRIDYRNRYGSTWLHLFSELLDVPGASREIVPRASLRSQDGNGNWVSGLRGDYYTLSGGFIGTVYGEGPIYHGWDSLYEGETDSDWGPIDDPNWGLFQEVLTGQVYIPAVSTSAREVRFDVDADDYAELWIDGNSVGLIDYIPGGSFSATLDLAPGWHDIQLDYRNRYGSTWLHLFSELLDVTGGTREIVPRASLRSLDESGSWVAGLKGDYYTLSGDYIGTVYGEGPIYHGWDGLYEGETSSDWGPIDDPNWGLFQEVLTGQVYISEPADSITVLSPNSGETLYRNQVASIQWSSAGNVGANVKLVARRGTGSAVVAASTPNDGVFDWMVPALFPTGNNFIIEVSSVDSPAILDQSDAFFTVTVAPVVGSITVLTPNGGESVLRGSVYPIQWTSTGDIGANVKIYLRKGSQGATIASSTPNDGSFEWTVPNYPIGSDYSLEISSASHSGIIDTSDGLFSLVNTPPQPSSITVTSPNGGESYVRGTSTAITWTSSGAVGSNVKITLRKGGKSLVVAASTANSGSYVWSIPTSVPNGSDYIIEISSVSTPAIVDVSNGSFSLTN